VQMCYAIANDAPCNLYVDLYASFIAPKVDEVQHIGLPVCAAAYYEFMTGVCRRRSNGVLGRRIPGDSDGKIDSLNRMNNFRFSTIRA